MSQILTPAWLWQTATTVVGASPALALPSGYVEADRPEIVGGESGTWFPAGFPAGAVIWRRKLKAVQT